MFFVRSGKPYANAYDVTCKVLRANHAAAACTTVHDSLLVFADIFAPALYWTQLEGALAVVSACLPTMRPLFHGFSLESMMGSFRAKIPTYWKLHEGSKNQISTIVPPIEEDQSPLNRTTKPNHAGSIDTYIASVGMDDLEAGGIAHPAGIAIRRDLASHSETS